MLYKSLRQDAPFGDAVDAPDEVVADISNLERTFWANVVPEWPLFPYKEWAGLFADAKDSGTSSGTGKELESLPKASTSVIGGGWVISFCNFGIMNEEGHLIYNLVCHDTASYSPTVRFMVLSSGKPTLADLEQCVYQAATRPLAGEPHVPATILLANRWVEALGSDAVAAFRSKLANALSVQVEVEPRYKAKMSAANNNTDPDGNNFDFVEYDMP